MPVREVLTLSIGQGGVQLGNAVWNQYCAEHNVLPNGTLSEEANKDDHYFWTFFEETAAGQCVPRNLCVDLEPSVIDDIKRGPTASMYHGEFLLNAKEDAANNFARGHYTVGKEIMPLVEDRIRKMVDNSENVQGFLVNHAVGGGTGSGLGSLILEKLANEYRKKSSIGFEIYPSPNISTSIVEPYNGLLSTHFLLDNSDISLVLDNEALYHICQHKLDIKKPSYENLNRIIAKVVSSMTAALRFAGELNVDMNEFQTNLVPFPRLHFMTSSLAPIVSAEKASRDGADCRRITDECLQPHSFLVKYEEFDVNEDKYMAISVNYRGLIKSQVANKTINWVKTQGKVQFVEWCPTGFKIGLNDVPVAHVPGDDMAPMNRGACMIGNNVAVNRVFANRLSKKYDMMYSQRAYVHWYVGEGMEEGEFAEAREDLGFLEKDYLDVVSEQASDEDYEEEF
jgi:tubulin alpha